MRDWRDFSSDIKFHLRDAKEKGINSLDADKVETFIVEMEADYIQLDKFDILNQINKPANEEMYLDKIVENQIKAISATYDKGSAYTSLVIGAGYASFFGIWSVSKDYVSEPCATYALLLLILSAITFVFFEVYKNILTTFNLVRKSKAAVKARKMRTFKEQYTEIMKAESAKDLANILFIPIWATTATIAILTAVGGVGILITSLVIHAMKTLKVFS